MSAVGMLLPGRYLGAGRVAHAMFDRGERFGPRATYLRFESRCGLFLSADPLEADLDRVPACRRCEQYLASDQRRADRLERQRVLPSPYQVGDRARVLHRTDAGTTLGVLPVARVEPANRDGQWLVEFDLARPDGTRWPAYVGPDGRDRHGYIEPVRR